MTKRRRARRAPVQQQSNNRRNLIVGAAAVLGIAALGFLLFLNTRPPEPLEGLIDYGTIAGNQHDETLRIAYEALPPHSGVHNPAWQNCGIYDQPIRPENAVHSLEHGAVWITYQEDLPAEDVEYLRQFARGESHILLTPYPNQESTVVMTAWGLQMEVDDLPDDRITTFIRRYQQGPQTPERGATCERGVGTPIEQ